MGRNPCKCERCKEFYDSDLLLLEGGTKHQLPVSCKACPYTICHSCFHDWLAKDQHGLVQCPDCDTIDGFNADEPNVNHFACLLMASGDPLLATSATKARSIVAAKPLEVAKAPSTPLKSEHKPAAVTPTTLKTKKRTQDDAGDGQALEYDDDESVAEPVPKKPPPKRRKKTKTSKFQITEDELEALEEHSIIGDDQHSGIEKYLREVETNSKGEGLSEKNVKSIMRQVKRFCSGEGTDYKNWPRGVKFLEGEEVHLGMDFENMLQAAKDFEDKYGKDKGNGWLLKHPIKKLGNYQKWVLENEIRARKDEADAEDDETEEEVEEVTTEVAGVLEEQKDE